MTTQAINFRKMDDSAIDERIARIGGVRWVSRDDYRRFSRQATLILESLLENTLQPDSPPMYSTRGILEIVSGSKRVASRIDELRDDWDIESKRIPGGGAAYRLIGRRTEPREKKAHCTTCHCFYKPAEVPEGQIGMNI